MTITIAGAEEAHSYIGQRLGHSEWVEISQRKIDLFAEATGDFQWIHVDPTRAKSGPFGSTVAHGYLTLSLAPALLHDVVRVEGFSMGVNYGLNKVRFPSPVPVGSCVRLVADLLDVVDVDGGIQLAYRLAIEVQGSDKPACVAEAIYRLIL
jgi:acyl dehydratase